MGLLAAGQERLKSGRSNLTSPSDVEKVLESLLQQQAALREIGQGSWKMFMESDEDNGMAKSLGLLKLGDLFSERLEPHIPIRLPLL